MKNLFSFLLCLTVILSAEAQSVGISTNSSLPDPSAMLDINSTDKGMLIPRLTTDQRANISDPAESLMVYDIDTGSFWYFTGQEWREIGSAEKFNVADCVQDTFVMNTTPLGIITDQCGVLYDSGGKDGPYLDNEYINEEIVGSFGGNVRRVIVKSTVLFTGDTLSISNIFFSKDYTGINFDMDTLYLPADESIVVNFRSDSGPSTGDGFEIVWDTYEANALSMDQRSGFFCNPEKQTFGGGLQLNNEWTSGTGFRNINFGVFADTDGESSIAIGTFSKSNELSLALGKESFADDQGVAVGYNAKANLFGSVALGKARAIGNTSIATGFNAWAGGDNAISIGLNSRADGFDGISIGNSSQSTGAASVVIGNNSFASGANALIFGNEVSSACDDCIVIGKEGFNAPKVGINTLDPSAALEVSGDVKAEKLDIQDDFGEIAITSNNATLQPALSLYKTASYDFVGSLTSNLQNNLVMSAPDGILNEGNTLVSGSLSTSSLTGSGNRDVYVNSVGRLIVKPTETKYYSIPPSSFVSDNADDYPLATSSFDVSSNASGVFDEVDEYELYASVNLESGVSIQKVDFYYWTSLDEMEIDFRLMRRPMNAIGTETICHVIASGAAPDFTHVPCTDVNGSYAEIDNENYIYFIQIGMPGDELPTDLFGGFHSVRIEYDD